MIMKGGITSGGGLSPDHLQARDSLPTPQHRGDLSRGDRRGDGRGRGVPAAKLQSDARSRIPDAGRATLDVSKRLPSLFQASTGTRGIFDVLLAWMKDGWLAGLRQVVRSKRAWFWAGVAIVR